LCSLFYVSFSLAIFYSFSMTLSTLMLLWTLEFRKRTQLPTKNTNYFWQLPCFFLSLNISLVTFIFLRALHFLINARSSKLIHPIIPSLCVSYTTAWKHFTSSLWINVANFIFQLLHIVILSLLDVLTPPSSHVLLLTMPINLLNVTTHLLTIPIFLLIVPTNLPLMTKQMLLLI
jgi:hypothetical protein